MSQNRSHMHTPCARAILECICSEITFWISQIFLIKMSQIHLKSFITIGCYVETMSAKFLGFPICWVMTGVLRHGSKSNHCLIGPGTRGLMQHNLAFFTSVLFWFLLVHYVTLYFYFSLSQFGENPLSSSCNECNHFPQQINAIANRRLARSIQDFRGDIRMTCCQGCKGVQVDSSFNLWSDGGL